MIVDDIRRAMFEHRQNNSIPSVIRMSRNTFDQFVHECEDVICHKTDHEPVCTLYGMKIIIEPYMSDNTMAVMGEEGLPIWK